MQTNLSNTIFYNIVVTIDFVYAIGRMYILVGCTICTKVIPNRRNIRIILNETNSSIHVFISTEIVGFIVNLYPHTRITSRTKAILNTVFTDRPSSFSTSVFIKFVCNFAYFVSTHIKLVVTSACIAITTVNSLPTSLQYAVDRIVEITIHFKDTCAGSVYFTTFFIGTYKLTVNYRIGVFDYDLRNYCSPIDNGLTSFAISSVLIARLSSSCFLIKNSKICVVYVIR